MTTQTSKPSATHDGNLIDHVPTDLRELDDPQRDLPRFARDPKTTARLESAAKGVASQHALHLADSRDVSFLTPESVHLVVTSPPY